VSWNLFELIYAQPCSKKKEKKFDELNLNRCIDSSLFFRPNIFEPSRILAMTGEKTNMAVYEVFRIL